MGCGPQEEFRACADVAITEADGSADSSVNDLFDPEVYVPTSSRRPPSMDIDNTIDYNKKEEDQWKTADEEGLAIVNVVLIVILTLVVVLMFFAGVYLYYMRGGKQYFSQFKDK